MSVLNSRVNSTGLIQIPNAMAQSTASEFQLLSSAGNNKESGFQNGAKAVAGNFLHIPTAQPRDLWEKQSRVHAGPRLHLEEGKAATAGELEVNAHP